MIRLGRFREVELRERLTERHEALRLPDRLGHPVLDLPFGRGKRGAHDIADGLLIEAVRERVDGHDPAAEVRPRFDPLPLRVREGQHAAELLDRAGERDGVARNAVAARHTG